MTTSFFELVKALGIDIQRISAEFFVTRIITDNSIQQSITQETDRPVRPVRLFWSKHFRTVIYVL